MKALVGLLREVSEMGDDVVPRLKLDLRHPREVGRVLGFAKLLELLVADR